MLIFLKLTNTVLLKTYLFLKKNNSNMQAKQYEY